LSGALGAMFGCLGIVAACALGGLWMSRAMVESQHDDAERASARRMEDARVQQAQRLKDPFATRTASQRVMPDPAMRAGVTEMNKAMAASGWRRREVFVDRDTFGGFARGAAKAEMLARFDIPDSRGDAAELKGIGPDWPGHTYLSYDLAPVILIFDPGDRFVRAFVGVSKEALDRPPPEAATTGTATPAPR
jgi:hypothetical protein